jgi:hypothetical protein
MGFVSVDGHNVVPYYYYKRVPVFCRSAYEGVL